MMTDKEIATYMVAMRERSGNVVVDCKLTSFLYTLMRDHVALSTVEQIMMDNIDAQPVTYSNGWLASYANDIANRLLSQPQVTELKDDEFYLEPDEMKL